MHFIVIKLKWLIAGAAALAACLLIFTGINSAVPPFSVGGREIPIYSVEREDNKIALTFDCAWNADDIERILDTLDEYGCKATFFIVGDWALKYPDSVKEIYDRGHEIGTHSMSHGDYTAMTTDEIIDDIYRCESVILNITGDRPVLVRAPSGAYNDNVIRTCEENRRIYIQWSVDALDYPEDATEESIYNRAVSGTAAGDIILLHNGTEHTADVLPRILSALTRDYELVKVLDLIYTNDFTIDHTGRQFPANTTN
ncbi:MAG: polysaccharide deacetylase family protein [Firmicutes bacterium]|nr:polysaccharide deacetylase family protein [Bacillota bacterium]